MNTEDILNSYQAIYGTLDDLTVRGVRNCKAIARCAQHIENQMENLRVVVMAENKVKEAVQHDVSATAADEVGSVEEAT